MTSSNGNIFRVTVPLCGTVIHRSPVDSPQKGTVARTVNVFLLSVWTNCWTNTRSTGNSRRHYRHNDVKSVCHLGVDMKRNPNVSRDCWKTYNFPHCKLLPVINTSMVNNSYVRHLTRSSLFQVMAWHQTDDKPLSEKKWWPFVS